ncbi:PREDICTED: putative late blight resistance protein homolog R1B-17 [Nicotiana attenuata]|uniref:Late blight resistance protein -like r1b-17 n=1 Tax=Nicotiana attenuata TaxID=49451 RepID=A0A314KS43_NICAT|nr:PREDICTED: putative late blight resistance protein homolog R1B-17 [Nicotiana attenuata]OIT32015.1 putative late blight resistance protein -like r1b-17 [Nicotiana attenuata]
MAYTSVISLLQTVEQLQQRNPKLIQGQTVEMLYSLHTTAEYFKNILEKVSKSRFNLENIKSLEEKIRVAVNDTEDVVELKICQIFEGLSWTGGKARKSLLHKDLSPVVEKMDITKKEVMDLFSDFSTSTYDAGDEILESGDSLVDNNNNNNKPSVIPQSRISGVKCTQTLLLPCEGKEAVSDRPPAQDVDPLVDSSSRSNPMINSEDVIAQGLDDDLEIIVKRLTGPESDLDIVTISGMGGIGKTTLAKKAHDHLPIRYHFDIRVWVTRSQEFRSRNVLLDALQCISKQTNIVKREDYDKEDDSYDKEDDSELADLVQKILKGRRYLVVVDDIWCTDVWDSIRGIFPDCNNRSRILLTTRETEVAVYANPSSPHEMNLLNLDNSWKLLRDKVFGPEHVRPLELEAIGKQIAEKCQGLPLTISVIAGHLSKIARTLESWTDVAQTLSEIIASHSDKCLGVLGLSYHHLPNHLKPCFLSMGSFPEDFHVETCQLIQLWIAEGFIRTSGSGKSLEKVAEDYLEDLISRNLIMARKRRFNGEIKACGIHDLLHEFCLIEAEMTKFMHVARTDPIRVTQKHNVRRFSFQTPSYSVYNYSKVLPHVSRSIYLFSGLTGLEVFSRFNLLRVLHIFHEDERFDSFPLAITKLFHLRYLAVGFYGSVPTSISELQNLQTLITHGKNYRNITLPGKIWTMTNLRLMHLGSNSYFPRPRRKGIPNKHNVIEMPNLEELFGLCSTSCSNEVFSGIPNLKKLIIYYASFRTNNMAKRFIDMSCLTKLEALKCLRGDYSPYSIKSFRFPASLKRLTLTGWFEFPWEDISTLVMLPYLEELKLKRWVVGDEVWRLSNEEKFENLNFLLFCQLDFRRWEASSDSFPNLKRLVLNHCPHLEEIPTDFGEICTLESIELHNCSTSAEDSARNIEQEQEDMGNNCLKVYIHRTQPKF